MTVAAKPEREGVGKEGDKSIIQYPHEEKASATSRGHEEDINPSI